MKLKKAIFRNYRGISGEVEIAFEPSTILVGRNDAGKSTILRGLDLFLNNNEAHPDIKNVFCESNECEIELAFSGDFPAITIDDSIETSFEEELLLDDAGLLRVKKVWDASKSKITPETFIHRATYGDDDFLLLTEKQLLTLCRGKNIETRKANGEEFNNREKRQKLRQNYSESGLAPTFTWEKLPTSGTSRAKSIHDQLKNILPKFEYFRADASLSESDTSIQKYFREIAERAMHDAGLTDLQTAIETSLSEVMGSITRKINNVMPDADSVRPSISFDWSKVVQTGFKSRSDEAEIPLSFRGDGFRRITMMAYFEHLAEENLPTGRQAIFGFEEPETFLHPKAQEQLHEKIIGLVDAGYQVIATTHSPIIVAASEISSIAHVKSDSRNYEIIQNIADLEDLALDLGITPDNQFIKLFERAKVLVLVEGPDDVKAFNYVSQVYKTEGQIRDTFSDLQILLVPVGGCDSVMHWINLHIVQELDKPFFALQDSDRETIGAISPTQQKLINLGLVENQDFCVLRKRALENYISVSALERLIPGITIAFDDFTHLKNMCKQHNQAVSLGGGRVADKHFCSQNFQELQTSFRNPDGSDEFLHLYGQITAKLPTNV